MADYDLKALHGRILNILLALDKVSREHGLRYSISFGTMLGAVRHGGFIPWDDDLDISMPRPDYEVLIAHSSEWLPKPYEFVCAENDPTYPLPFGKIQDASTTLIERRHLYYLGGVYIDVFPEDGYPDSAIGRRMQRLRYDYLKKVLYFIHRDPYRHGHGPASWLPLLARRFYTMDGVQRRLRRVMTRYSYDDSRLACSYTESYDKISDKKLLATYAPYTFEGHTVQGVADYDRYLSLYYGDYMTLPPEDRRVQHNFDYLDLDRPYSDYRP